MEDVNIKNTAYYKYGEDVLSGKIPACRYIQLAVKRFFVFLYRPDLEFHKEKVDKVLKFCGNMVQFQSPFNNKPLILSPWQEFFIANIYGFYYKGTDDRVCQHAILEIGRKAGKTAICSVLALYHLVCESDGQVEIDCCAMTRTQAKILFDMAVNFAKKMDPNHKFLKPTINKLRFTKNDSYFQVLASETASLDGYGAQVFFMDEAAAQKDSKLYDVLQSSQGARHNPLSFILTSANYNLYGPHVTQWRKAAIDSLENLMENDSLFALIFTLDEGDDFKDQNVWIKSNPNLDVTVTKRYLKDRIDQCKSNPNLEVDVKTKNFNMYVQSAESWLPDHLVYDSMEIVNLNDYKGEQCWTGIDLSSVSDLSAIGLMFPPNEFRKINPDKYVFKVIPYVPGLAIQESSNRDFYQRCINAGHLRDTKSKAVDYDEILKDLLQINQNLIIIKNSYDQWNSTQFTKDAINEGLEMVEFSQSLANFNIPTKEFERLLREGKVIIDANVVVRWCFGNCQLKIDHNDNCKPVKAEDDQNKKIDCVIAILEALGGWLKDQDYYYGPSDNELNKQNQK